VVCETGAAVGSQESTQLGARGWVFAARVVSDSGLPTLPRGGPEGESLVIPYFIEDADCIRALHWLVRLRRYPVRPDRCVKRAHARDTRQPALCVKCESYRDEKSRQD
jgi:hypothetical protein